MTFDNYAVDKILTVGKSNFADGGFRQSDMTVRFYRL